MLAVGWLFVAFIMFRYGPWIPVLSKTFNMKWFWILSNAFLASSEITMCFFFFEFVYMVDYINGFPYIKASLHPRDEVYLVRMNDCFDVFLDSVFKNFVAYFSSIFINEIGLKFSLSVESLCGLGTRVIVTSKN